MNGRDHINSLLDIVGELFSDEISIAVSTTKEYVYYRSSKRIDLKISIGDAVKEGTIAYKALELKQKVSEFINRDVFGIAPMECLCHFPSWTT